MRLAGRPSHIVAETYIFDVSLIRFTSELFKPLALARKRTMMKMSFSMSACRLMLLGKSSNAGCSRKYAATLRANRICLCSTSIYPVRPYEMRVAYTGRPLKRREFSIPTFSGDWIALGAVTPVLKYAALGLWNTCRTRFGWRQKKKPQSYGTFKSLCPSPVIESASSSPSAPRQMRSNSGKLFRILANAPKARIFLLIRSRWIVSQ